SVPSNRSGSILRIARLTPDSGRASSRNSLTDAPYGVADIADHPNDQSSAALVRTPHDLVLQALDAEERSQNTACVGRGGLRPPAAVLVGHRHDVPRVRAGREHDVPRLVRLADALGRAGLAADLHREVLEHVVGGALRVVSRAEEAVHDRLAEVRRD